MGDLIEALKERDRYRAQLVVCTRAMREASERLKKFEAAGLKHEEDWREPFQIAKTLDDARGNAVKEFPIVGGNVWGVLCETLKERNKARDERDEAVRERDTAVRAHDAVNEAACRETAKFRAQLEEARKNAEFMAERERALDSEYKKKIAERDAIIERLTQWVSDGKEVWQARDKMLSALGAHSNEHGLRTIAERDAELGRLREHNKLQQSTLHELHARMKEKDAEIARLRALCSRLAGTCREVAAELRVMRVSFMYKLPDLAARLESAEGGTAPESVTPADTSPERVKETPKTEHIPASEPSSFKDFNTYQVEACRTANKDLPSLLETATYALGIAGEAGEVADLLKKHVGHGVPLEHAKLKKELGDVLWYIAVLADNFFIPLQDVVDANITKLRARYPGGFVQGGGNRSGEAA